MSEQSRPLSDRELLHELNQTAEVLLERHLSVAKDWNPARMVPADQMHDYAAGEQWSADDYPLPEGVRSSLFVNLLTEDNLPYYSQVILNIYKNEVLQTWGRHWTAEEARHSIVIRDWAIRVGALDPDELEKARMTQVTRGQVPQLSNVRDATVYAAMQELATQIAHRNTGAQLNDRAGRKIMGVVAGDEARHYNFYRDLAAAAFELDPSSMTIATQTQLESFEMPGTGIPNFKKHAFAIASAGIYNYKIHKEKVVDTAMQTWGMFELEGLSAEAEIARERIQKHINKLGRVAVRFEEHLETAQDRAS